MQNSPSSNVTQANTSLCVTVVEFSHDEPLPNHGLSFQTYRTETLVYSCFTFPSPWPAAICTSVSISAPGCDAMQGLQPGLAHQPLQTHRRKCFLILVCGRVSNADLSVCLAVGLIPKDKWGVRLGDYFWLVPYPVLMLLVLTYLNNLRLLSEIVGLQFFPIPVKRGVACPWSQGMSYPFSAAL